MSRIEVKEKQTISQSCSLFVTLLVTISTIILIILNITIEEPLFEMGINFQYRYQQQINSNVLKSLNNYLTIILNVESLNILSFVYLAFTKRRLIVLTHISFLFIARTVGYLIKQNLQHPRPFWYNDKIENWDWQCKTDFGNPSDHIILVIMLVEPLLSDITGYIRLKSCKILAWLLSLFTLLIMNSRFYLGVHGLNQIIFGLGLGIALLVLYKYAYQKAIFDLFSSLLRKQKNFIRLATIVTINILFIVIPIAFYYINTSQRPLDESYLSRIYKSCHKNVTGEDLQNKQMYSNSFVLITFGIVYGFIFLRNSPTNRQYLLGYWQYENYQKMFVHVLVYVVLIAAPFLSIRFINKLVKGAVLNYMISVIINFILGFFLSFIIPVLVGKFNIIKTLPKVYEK